MLLVRIALAPILQKNLGCAYCIKHGVTVAVQCVYMLRGIARVTTKHLHHTAEYLWLPYLHHVVFSYYFFLAI